jgi:hypothetical protein
MNRKALASWVLCASLAMTICVLFFSAQSLQAQVDTGSITGTITDSSSAVVGGAKVTLTNEGTSASLSTTADASGAYTFNPVRIGTYSITVSYQGFQTMTQKNITVNVGSSLVVNFGLKPGQVTEVVEVTSTTPLLETQTSSVGQVIDQKSVNDLPLNGRNFTFLAQLGAGINTPQSDTRGNAASGAFVANGLRSAQNNYLLDGIDNNSDTVDFLNGTNFVVLPPVDAIQEFKVQTTGFSAEYGRSGAAVLNATIKSGTNNFHGAAWEFFRNDIFDSADYFEKNGKGELRLNQFGGTIGGPIIKNKVFFFGDYEGLRRRQGVVKTGSVPTALERGDSGDDPFSNLSDLVGAIDPNRKDALGRVIPTGTILDPATTRPVTIGVTDPVSTRVATATGFVRDPFGSCGANTAIFDPATCNLNHIPGPSSGIATNRLNPNAVNLMLQLYPKPNLPGLTQNFVTSPVLRENRNAFDTRLDFNLSDKNQIFTRFSLVDDPQFIPSIFGGIADGGAFQEGDQTALSQQSVLAWTHVFSSNMVNVARAGLNYLHTTRVSPAANDLSDIPSTFGILGIPQVTENGGLPTLEINGLATLGTNGFLPSDEVSSTFQFTDDLTKIYSKHTFKMGMEWQHVKFSTLQPPWSKGDFRFQGAFVDIPGASPDSNASGRAQFLLQPKTNNFGNTAFDFAGGSNNIDASNISLSDNGKNYWGFYGQDDWKVTPKLTVNLGLRWDFFGLVYDHFGKQANFVSQNSPTGSPVYLIQTGPFSNNGNLSSGCPTCFTDLMTQDGIQVLITDKYGKGLGNSQKTNFAPRVGFAYQVTPKFVARGGFGLFYNGFENRGYFPNLGENYPFQFQFHEQVRNQGDTQNVDPGLALAPITYPDGCGTATLESGLSCYSFDPTTVTNAKGLSLRGIQFDYVTPYSMGGNLTFQYEVTPTLSVQTAYVTTLARHLEVFPGSNNVSVIAPPGSSLATVPFPDFAQGSPLAKTIGNSVYHGLQTKVEKRFASGLNFLLTYTWSKTLTDAVDLLNGGNTQGYRAPDVPGFGITKDYALANSDIRNVFHFSGGYQLPFGKGKKYMTNGGAADKLLGGWSVIWAATLQGGQPFAIPCQTGTASGLGCHSMLVPGVDPFKGGRTVQHWINQAAFVQPCKLGGTAADSDAPNNPAGSDCIPFTGADALGFGTTQLAGPTFKRLDFSTFKDFNLSERFRLQFRAEFFNILNHPNFNAPGFGGNGVNAVSGALNYTQQTGAGNTFGAIGSTRDAPNDPRQIQFALKLYY